MKIIRIVVLSVFCLLMKLAAADQMVSRAYDGEVQECYAALQKVATTPTVQALHSSIQNICSSGGGGKVAYKFEKLNYTDVNTVIFICFQDKNSGLSPLFGCRYYLSGFSL